MEKVRNFSGYVAMHIHGFKNLTWGKPLWIIVMIKLFIMFVILKIFFFPNILNSQYKTDKEKSEHVSKELTKIIFTNN